MKAVATFRNFSVFVLGLTVLTVVLFAIVAWLKFVPAWNSEQKVVRSYYSSARDNDLQEFAKLSPSEMQSCLQPCSWVPSPYGSVELIKLEGGGAGKAVVATNYHDSTGYSKTRFVVSNGTVTHHDLIWQEERGG